MAREIDKRDPGVNQTTPARTRSLNRSARKVSESLRGPHRLSIESFDAATGNPSLVASEGAEAGSGNYVERALSHVQSIGAVLGLEETQAPEFMADPNVQVSSSGAATVHLQQQYKGIRLFQTAQGVRFNPDGSIGETVGKSVTIAHELEVAPKLNVQDAVLSAARHLAEPGAYEEEVGEIWCAALMEMNRKIGRHLGVQLVIDALKLSPVRPSFLDMRDAILKALDHKLAAGQLGAPEHAAARGGVWAAFACFGMGPAARSNGASLTGIVPDFNTPPVQPET